MRGKIITLHIMGDEVKNLKSVNLSNWTGKAYIGERKHVNIIQDIDELSNPGIYFLISQTDNDLQKMIYIGEADEVNKRFISHYREKDWWDSFVIFISNDLTKAHVRYLEKKFYLIAKSNPTTINLKNNNEPTGSKLPISDIDFIEDYSDNIIYVLQNLHIIDFTKIKEEEQIINVEQQIFYLNLTTDRTDKNGNILQA